MDQLVMSGLVPAGSGEGEEERSGAGEGKQKGRDASVGAVCCREGSSKGRSSRLRQAVGQKACPSSPNQSDSSAVN